MMPNMSLSQSASSGATGGSQGVTNNAISEGDWNVNNAPNSTTGSTNLNSKTMMYVAAAAAALWYLKNKKAA